MSKPSLGWNSRYVAYANAHGKTARTMLPFDRKRWPGGVMCGYIIWINGKWNEFAKAIGVERYWAGLQQDRFDAWLKENAST